MAEKIEVWIAVVVGDNRNIAAAKFQDGDTDWGFLSDSVGLYNEETKEVEYQKAERRYVVKALVELPEIETVVASSVSEQPPT